VSVDVITTEGESDVLGNLKRKADAADTMFSYMVQEMNAAQSKRAPQINAERRAALPAWLPSEATCSQN
jgi:dsDNA-binding SOS-regulon protein